MIRVLLVHDHVLTRASLRRILDVATGIQVVGEASSADEGLAAVRRHDPDVIVIGGATPGLDDLDAVRRRRAPHTEILLIIVTGKTRSVDSGRLLRTGALGYVATQSEPAELIEAVRTVHDGDRYVCRQLKHALEHRRLAEDDAQDPLARLTKRERQVFRMLAVGRTTRETAADLGLSRKTVSAHRAHVLAKLRLRNNAELACFAIEHKVVND